MRGGKAKRAAVPITPRELISPELPPAERGVRAAKRASRRERPQKLSLLPLRRLRLAGADSACQTVVVITVIVVP